MCQSSSGQILHNAELIIPGVDHINRTGRVVAGALPLLYEMAEGIVVGATYEPAPAGAVRGAGHAGVGPLAGPGCTTESATCPTRSASP